MHNTPSIPALSAESSDLFSVRQVQVFIGMVRGRDAWRADSCWKGDENTVYAARIGLPWAPLTGKLDLPRHMKEEERAEGGLYDGPADAHRHTSKRLC